VSEATCIFCQIVRRQRQSTIVYQDDDVTAFRDANPQAPTHILIVPNEHIESISDLGPEHAALWMKMMLVANQVATQEGIAQSGYRLVVNRGPQAGQSVFHLHLHLLGGRWLRWPPG
jgi:histidine triad (HIT) family protein